MLEQEIKKLVARINELEQENESLHLVAQGVKSYWLQPNIIDKLTRERDEARERYDNMVAERYAAEAQVAALQAQVANWEHKEISRASCCSDNEQAVAALQKQLDMVVEAYKNEPNLLIAAAMHSVLKTVFDEEKQNETNR